MCHFNNSGGEGFLSETVLRTLCVLRKHGLNLILVHKGNLKETVGNVFIWEVHEVLIHVIWGGLRWVKPNGIPCRLAEFVALRIN